MEQNEVLEEQLKSLFPEHNYNRKYEPYSIVLCTTEKGSDLYLSLCNVPRHIAVTNEHFWKPLNKVKSRFHNHNVTPDTPEEPVEINPYADDPLTFVCLQDNSTISPVGRIINKNIEDFGLFNLEYSYDKTNWITLENSTEPYTNNSNYTEQTFDTIILNEGDILYLRGNNKTTSFQGDDQFLNIKTTGFFDLRGQLKSLCNNKENKEIFESFESIFLETNYRNLFNNNNGNITSTFHSLKYLVLSPAVGSEYTYMFAGQTNIIDYPNLNVAPINALSMLYAESKFSNKDDLIDFMHTNVDSQEDLNQLIYHINEELGLQIPLNITIEEWVNQLDTDIYSMNKGTIPFIGMYYVYDIQHILHNNNVECTSLFDENNSLKFKYNFKNFNIIYDTIDDNVLAVLLGNVKDVFTGKFINIVSDEMRLANYKYQAIEVKSNNAFGSISSYEGVILEYINNTSPITIETKKTNFDGYPFVKWQISSDEGETYTDYSTNREISVDLSDGNVYLKIVYDNTQNNG